MEPFPFTETEWDRITEISLSLTNASLANDEVLEASLLLTFLEDIDKLRVQHGEHPVLDETEADFLPDPWERIVKYRSAIRMAEDNSLPTMSIRVSLAGVYLDDFSDYRRALVELRRCEPELATGGRVDEDERQHWEELIRKCTDLQTGQT